MSECPDCERHKQRVELWRQEAYRLSERQWVGLTFEEKQHALYLSDWKTTYMEAVIEYLEAKLKEKNV